VHPHTATCPAALDSASLPRRAPVLPRAPRLQTPPPCSGGLQCYHMLHSFGPRLPTEVASGAATCPPTLDPVSLPRRAPVLPRLQIMPPCWGGGGGSGTITFPTTLRGLHALILKERLRYNNMQQDLRVSKIRPRVTEASTKRVGKRHYHDLQTMQTYTTVPCYSASPHD
jgi:hypothetical protein